MPVWLMQEKYQACLATAILDGLFHVQSIFGLTDQVKTAFPTLESELKWMGFEVRHHYHDKKAVGKGRWNPPLEMTPENMIYDRRYVLQGLKDIPDNEAVAWHIDHMNYNLLSYLEFLGRLKE